ncbi:MAG: phosphodiester glycosidase family protein [Vampirovibrionales bacterium]|nr:phosphodiester glycosidase family protein [Vampirovibrionales bacterium]
MHFLKSPLKVSQPAGQVSLLTSRLLSPVALLSLLGFSALLSLTLFNNSRAAGPAFSEKTLNALKQPPANALRIETRSLKQGNVYYAIIPSDYPILPLVSEKLQSIERFHPSLQKGTSQPLLPLAVINAGYFDPQNHKTISYVTQNGKIIADPTQNERLTQNPNLKPYLAKIFNRSEFRIYDCPTGSNETIEEALKSETSIRYDITPHQAPVPTGCKLTHALGAGPQLLPLDRSLEEAVIDTDASGKLIRDPFGVKAPNARSAIGITKSGNVILLMGAQDPARNADGFTFEQIRSLLSSLGASKALSLDGGSSSAIMLKGLDNQLDSPLENRPKLAMPVIYGKYNKDGQPVKRPIKSVLMVLSPMAP